MRATTGEGEGTGQQGAAAEAAAAVAAGSSGPPVTALLPGAGALLVRGPDAVAFLHGQLAADVTGTPIGGALRSLLLNHRGHAVAEVVVLRGVDEVVLVVDDDMVEWVATTLAEHVVFDDVALFRFAAGAIVTVQGVASEAVATRAGYAIVSEPAPVRWLPSGVGVAVYRRRRSVAGGVDVAAFAQPRLLTSGGFGAAAGDGASHPSGALEGDATAAVSAVADDVVAGLSAAGAVAVAAAAIDAARVDALVSMAARDAGPGVLPQEAGLEDALSYRKGCYLGQEVMARIEARGSLKRGLVAVTVTGVPGAREIVAGGRQVGVLGTVATMPDGTARGLAVLRRDVGDDAALEAGGATLRRVPSAHL